MDWILVIISSSYLIFVSLLLIGWKRLPVWDLKTGHEPIVSVIIPVRDEAGHIGGLLDDLEGQSYPSERFEVIMVDDNSRDNTYSLLKGRLDRTRLNLKILQAPLSDPGGVSPKKRAITYGMDYATGDIILLTDGDVRLGDSWIRSYVSLFTSSTAVFISGPVIMHTAGFMDEVQAIEFASLIGTGAALIAFNMPAMCNGANLGFRREAFEKVHGYEGNENIVSGDDEFLMYKMRRQFHSGIFFLKSMHATAIIQPLHRFNDFYNQRRRWSGKWRKHTNPTSILLALYVFTVHLTLLMLLIAGFLKSISIHVVIMIWAAKMILEYFFLRSILSFFRQKMKMLPFIISSLLYSIYAVTFGLLSNSGDFEWKGRKFKN